MGDGQPPGVPDVVAKGSRQVVHDGWDVASPEHHRDLDRFVLARGVNRTQRLDQLGVPLLGEALEAPGDPPAGQPFPPVVMFVVLVQAR